MALAIQRYIVIGHIGSDAGYWYNDGHGWHHVGGWASEQLAEVTTGLQIMAQASRLKTPGMSDKVTATLTDFLSKELGAHLGDTPGAVGGAAGGATVIIVAT